MTSEAKVALVFGANGISGHAMLVELLKTPPTEWSKIIAVSRKPQQVKLADPRLKFVSVDLLTSDVADIAKLLREAGADQVTHVFHYTYLEGKDEQDRVKVNSTMLRKSLDALVSVAKGLKVFMLQIGSRYYGVHLGPVLQPLIEDMPRTFPNEPNFYFDQLEILKTYAAKHNFKWIDTRPAVIIGVSKANAMNMASCIGIYAAVQKELGLPLVFPGNSYNWDLFQDHSTASNNAQFQLFVSNHKDGGNQGYNIANGDLFKWRLVWPKIAEHFGLGLPEPLFKVATQDHFPLEKKIDRPIVQQGLVEYMKDKKPVWQKIAAKYGVDPNAIDNVNFAFADMITGMPIPCMESLTKARKLGWREYVDSAESYVGCFEQLREIKILPQY